MRRSRCVTHVHNTRLLFLSLRSSIKSSNHQSSSSSSSSSLSSCSSSSALAQELSQQASALPEAEANSQVDWTYDPNEPRYCICNQVRGRTAGQSLSDVAVMSCVLYWPVMIRCCLDVLQVSYGEMVGCDNTDVSMIDLRVIGGERSDRSSL